MRSPSHAASFYQKQRYRQSGGGDHVRTDTGCGRDIGSVPRPTYKENEASEKDSGNERCNRAKAPTLFEVKAPPVHGLAARRYDQLPALSLRCPGEYLVLIFGGHPWVLKQMRKSFGRHYRPIFEVRLRLVLVLPKLGLPRVRRRKAFAAFFTGLIVIADFQQIPSAEYKLGTCQPLDISIFAALDLL